MSPSSAQTSFSPEGVWSKNFDMCSLSREEDSTRFEINAEALKNYDETCRITGRLKKRDRSVLLSLQCGNDPRTTMRIIPKSSKRAVIYLPRGKGPRSREVVRCPASRLTEAAAEVEVLEATLKGKGPRSLTKLWLDVRKRCKPNSPGPRAEACAERRQIGARLREMGFCHYTRGSREGWRRCR
jgi:hypothetical protein